MSAFWLVAASAASFWFGFRAGTWRMRERIEMLDVLGKRFSRDLAKIEAELQRKTETKP